MGLHDTRVVFWATYHGTWIRGQRQLMANLDMSSFVCHDSTMHFLYHPVLISRTSTSSQFILWSNFHVCFPSADDSVFSFSVILLHLAFQGVTWLSHLHLWTVFAHDSVHHSCPLLNWNFVLRLHQKLPLCSTWSQCYPYIHFLQHSLDGFWNASYMWYRHSCCGFVFLSLAIIRLLLWHTLAYDLQIFVGSHSIPMLVQHMLSPPHGIQHQKSVPFPFWREWKQLISCVPEGNMIWSSCISMSL